MKFQPTTIEDLQARLSDLKEQRDGYKSDLDHFTERAVFYQRQYAEINKSIADYALLIGYASDDEAVAYVEAARDVDPDGSRGPADAECFDAVEAADVRQIEHDMAVEAGDERDPETCAYCGGA